MIIWSQFMKVQKMIYILHQNKMNKILEKRARDYPNFRKTSIQTFNDQRKEDKKYSRIMPMTRENLEWCEKLQSKYPY